MACYVFHSYGFYVHMVITILILIVSYFFCRLVCCMYKRLCRCLRRWGSCFTGNRNPPMPMILPEMFKESPDSDIDRFLIHLDLCLKKLNLTHGFYQVELDPTRQKQPIFETNKILLFYPSNFLLGVSLLPIETMPGYFRLGGVCHDISGINSSLKIKCFLGDFGSRIMFSLVGLSIISSIRNSKSTAIRLGATVVLSLTLFISVASKSIDGG